MKRRDFLKKSAMIAAGAAAGTGAVSLRAAATSPAREPYFLTRGIVLIVLTPDDLKGLDWPALAQQAGLTTIGLHRTRSGAPKEFLQECSQRGLQVEYELHAVGSLLPRALFAQDPTMFRMDEQGRRQRGSNLCVHSEKAVQIVCQNALQWAKDMRPTTGRYFYWIDDGQPMCRCEKCRDFSDSDQALLLENAMLTALRRADPRATLAHLAYARTWPAPAKVKPLPGIFLEFAPISRRYDQPLADRQAHRSKPGPQSPDHGQLLDLLDANLEVFGCVGAQMLDYCLERDAPLGPDGGLPKHLWHQEVFESDLRTYAQRGLRHLTSFVARLDSHDVKQYDRPHVLSYGAALRRWRLVGGQPIQD